MQICVSFPLFLNVLYLCESVEEGLGKSLAATTLSERILAAEDLGLLVLDLEAHAQFRNINLCSMIEAGVQTLQHRLRGQVQL